MISRRTRKEKDPGLDVSSLIDVSFLLLIYFLVTSTLDPREADLGITMPTEHSKSSTPKNVIDHMTIEVNSFGHIVVNEEVLDTDSGTRETPLLLDRLRTYVKTAELTQSEPIVIIAADDASKGQRFVDVLNALTDHKVAIENVTISGFKKE